MRDLAGIAALLAALLVLGVAQANAVGCLEPCSQDEMYSEEAEMCVSIESQAWT